MGAPTQHPLDNRSSGHRAISTSLSQGSKDHEDRPLPSALWTEDWEEDRAKDTLTGRFLSKKARTCLRCLSHDLRCTLEFSGSETEPRCSACRRAGAARCVRPALQDINPGKTLREQRRLFEAVPASSTTAAAAAAARRRVPPGREAAAPSTSTPTYHFPAEQATASWPAVIEEHHASERIVYVNGMPIDPRDVNAMTLPSFRDAAAAANANANAGADEDDALFAADSWQSEGFAGSPVLSPVVRNTTPWRTVAWSDYLPVPENRSLVGEEGGDADAFFVREVRWQLDDGGEDGDEQGLDFAEDNGGEGGGEDKDREVNFDDRIKFLQRIRRYPPRAMHLNEMLGETY